MRHIQLRLVLRHWVKDVEQHYKDGADAVELEMITQEEFDLHMELEQQIITPEEFDERIQTKH